LPDGLKCISTGIMLKESIRFTSLVDKSMAWGFCQFHAEGRGKIQP
jgi:hypothetical protein